MARMSLSRLSLFGVGALVCGLWPAAAAANTAMGAGAYGSALQGVLMGALLIFIPAALCHLILMFRAFQFLLSREKPALPKGIFGWNHSYGVIATICGLSAMVGGAFGVSAFLRVFTKIDEWRSWGLTGTPPEHIYADSAWLAVWCFVYAFFFLGLIAGVQVVSRSRCAAKAQSLDHQ